MDKRIKRLKNNEYAMNLAYKRLQQSVDCKVEQQIYAGIGELLLWVLTTDEWHSRKDSRCPEYEYKRDNDNDGRFILGLRHSYNIMKHIMDPYKIHEQRGGFSFPLRFPFNIKPIEIKWLIFNEDMKGKWRNQEENYKKFLQGKNVMHTFEKAMKFLYHENSLVINKFDNKE